MMVWLDWLEDHPGCLVALMVVIGLVLLVVVIITDVGNNCKEPVEITGVDGGMWETISSEESCSHYLIDNHKLDRMTIPGGVLYRSTWSRNRAISVGLAFVPNTVAERVKE